jgi:hypothetical protein
VTNGLESKPQDVKIEVTFTFHLTSDHSLYFTSLVGLARKTQLGTDITFKKASVGLVEYQRACLGEPQHGSIWFVSLVPVTFL